MRTRTTTTRKPVRVQVSETAAEARSVLSRCLAAAANLVRDLIGRSLRDNTFDPSCQGATLMPRTSRRSALGAIAVGMFSAAAGVFAVTAGSQQALSKRVQQPAPGLLPELAENPIEVENRLPGSRKWQMVADGVRAADDTQMKIKGYASATSVHLGESIDFHVAVGGEQDFTVAIYRLGYYGGAGGRLLATSPRLTGTRHPVPEVDPLTGLISCRWPSAWTLRIPADWTSGVYRAVFTTVTGWRNDTPFVVRDDHRKGGLCVILPFSTYQAYNQWPRDGKTGKNLYYGYDDGEIAYLRRAFKVSFDRPYADDGWPKHADRDHDFIQWVERCGYDVTYATSLDLHGGRIDSSRHAGLIFCGHDEYWSTTMRDAATRAVAQGTSLAFLGANNVYWRIRVEPASDGRVDRVVACYKKAVDPTPDPNGRTIQWRHLGIRGADAEQGLLGVQYNGIVATPQPLVVQAADHWFWAGCGVTNGDQIIGLVGGEADGIDHSFPRPSNVTQTVLSASPYRTRTGMQKLQNTAVYETPQGAVVFAAGTLTWTRALNREGFRDPRIEAATANLCNRMLRRGRPVPKQRAEAARHYGELGQISRR